MTLCPCCSGKNYADCCEPYHLGRLPEDAEALMRSRYSAYALDLPDYIIDTTHPLNPRREDNLRAWRSSIRKFTRMTRFCKLEVLHVETEDDKAYVIFHAYLEQQGQDVSFQERSLFERVGGKWLYRDSLSPI